MVEVIGQGARALLLRSDFMQLFIKTKMRVWLDLQEQQEVASMAASLHLRHPAVVVFPSAWNHAIDFADRFRGSERLRSNIVCKAELTSNYFGLRLEYEWGWANRVNTMVGMLSLCNQSRMGLYVFWETKTNQWPSPAPISSS
jgi:hypothetical protein